MSSYRARVDGRVTFTNGGGLAVEGFLLDVDGPDPSRAEVGQLLLSSLGLLMAGDVTLDTVEVIEAAHKGTRGGPSDPARAEQHTSGTPGLLVDLSHPITDGMTTYPGLPEPTMSPYLTRVDSRERYSDGTEFAIDYITMVGNTGTYLDAPYHRYEGGTDLADLPLTALVDLPAVVVRITDSTQRGVDANTLAAIDPARIRGAAVLLHTGDDARFRTPAYAVDGAHLTRDGAAWLVDQEAALVGIDALNLDALPDTSRPAHTLLLAAGIPVVENLTGLGQVPPFGARFSAVPARVVDFGTFPVRAYARIG